MVLSFLDETTLLGGYRGGGGNGNVRRYQSDTVVARA